MASLPRASLVDDQSFAAIMQDLIVLDVYAAIFHESVTTTHRR